MEAFYWSCRTTMELGLIRPCAWLDYLPPRASLLTSTCDQPSKTRTHKPNIHYTKEKLTKVTISKNDNVRTPQSQNINDSWKQPIGYQKGADNGKIPRCIWGDRENSQGKPYKIQLDPKVPPKQTPCRPVPIHLKEAFKAEIDKMLKAVVLKPIQEVTTWINSFVLVERTDQQSKPQTQNMFRPNKPE